MTGHDKRSMLGTLLLDGQCFKGFCRITVVVTLDLLCSHSFSEAQFPFVIINGLNMVLRCSFECTNPTYSHRLQ